jgi:hypothetical protein
MGLAEAQNQRLTNNRLPNRLSLARQAVTAYCQRTLSFSHIRHDACSMSLTEKDGRLPVLVPPVRQNFAFNRALHPDRPWIRAIRILVGFIVLAAIVQKTFDATLPGNDVDIPQLYSEFTVQANLAFGLVLIVSGVRRRARLPLWWDQMFGALVLYLVMTGLIYIVLVAPPEEPWWTWDLYWPQMVHHRLAPLVAALDWILVTRTVRGPWWRPLAWLGYPVAFLAFSWIRGGLDGWYVYDFLDPTLDGGWVRVLGATGQVLIAFLVVSLLVHAVGNVRVALATGKTALAAIPRASPSS